jgi:hypothetical protein
MFEEVFLKIASEQDFKLGGRFHSIATQRRIASFSSSFTPQELFHSNDVSRLGR